MSRTAHMTESIGDVLSDVGGGASVVEFVLSRELDPDLLDTEDWLDAVEDSEGEIAVRLGGTGWKAYFVYYDDGYCVTRNSASVRRYDRDDDYLSSLFDHYEPMAVLTEEVSAISV